MPVKRPEKDKNAGAVIKSEQSKIYEDKMAKTVSVLEEEFAAIRVGRANPKVLDRVQVDYYGSLVPISQVSNISVPEPRVLSINPWEANMTKPIEKAILASDLGLNPSNDGKIIRLTFPELTEERRKDLTKETKKKGEDAKVAIRNLRRDALDAFKKAQKAGDFTEDDVKELEREIQNLTDKYVAELDKKIDAKNKEIMTV